MNAFERALNAEGLTVSTIHGKGRGLVAAKDFLPGDVIICQEPYASSPSKSSTGSSCDGCFSTTNLRKCSGCRIAWYCGSACQKSEWKLHQLECKALSSLTEDKRKMLTPTIRLMIRLVLRRKLQNDRVIPTTATDNYDLVAALVSHMSDLDEKQIVLYAQMSNLVKVVLPSLEVDLREITQNFSKLSCNAHTICDDELRPLGTGLYPVVSIINHSCIPNSVLVFEGQIALVRAVEPIHKGDEVVISYIDTAATTETRQNSLNHYFFKCSCPRCTKNPLEELKEVAILEGYGCKDQKCFGFLFYKAENKAFTCQVCGHSRDEYDINRIANEVEKLSAKAASSLATGNLSEACLLYKKLEQLEVNLFHPHSVKLLGTRETLLKVFLELNDWRDALTCCQLTIPVYQRLYQSPHPLLGLQYYTCGKLEWLLEQTEDALKSFTKAVEILRITHGTSTPFMKELFSKLDEARAEHCYKLSAKDD
ncbi:histone-lysine N-methyltransferase ASHR1 [Dendrobium catenatum]|uniref:histone-lysine N-methyltransferase ASHR1 n=1 Tax=Dendrobium catenatum TaxID=906689 RepID=UPI0010A0BD22|nr:histone-lysine N-methyltransferase ASHR1 [Dendrobium catenatum]